MPEKIQLPVDNDAAGDQCDCSQEDGEERIRSLGMKDLRTAAQSANQYYEKRDVTEEQAASDDEGGSDDDAEDAKRIVSTAVHR